MNRIMFVRCGHTPITCGSMVTGTGQADVMFTITVTGQLQEAGIPGTADTGTLVVMVITGKEEDGIGKKYLIT